MNSEETTLGRIMALIAERIRRAPSASRYYWQRVRGLTKPEQTQTNALCEQVFREAVARGRTKCAADDFDQSSVEYRRQYWNQLARIDHKRAIVAQSGWTEDEFIDSGRFILRRLDGFELCDDSSGVLDLGCGAGRIAYHVAPRVRSLYGVDVSDEMVGRARKNLSHLNNVTILRSDGESLQIISIDQ